MGDSAYHQSKVKKELGLGLPAPQRPDGVQQKVRFLSFCAVKAHPATARATKSSKVTRCNRSGAVIEQTIADLKLAKVMNGNKISLIARLEKVLDCVIALHNLRVLLKANKDV